MSSSERIAVAAHLHVLLRRKTGRVTDTEWMATNQEYAHEIAQLAREKSAEEGNAELGIWADKLEAVMSTPSLPVPQTFAEQKAQAALNRNAWQASASEPLLGRTGNDHYTADRAARANAAGVSKEAPRYVAGLR